MATIIFIPEKLSSPYMLARCNRNVETPPTFEEIEQGFQDFRIIRGAIRSIRPHDYIPQRSLNEAEYLHKRPFKPREPVFEFLKDAVILGYATKEPLCSIWHRYVFADKPHIGGVHYYAKAYNENCQVVPSKPVDLQGLQILHTKRSREQLTATRELVEAISESGLSLGIRVASQIIDI